MRKRKLKKERMEVYLSPELKSWYKAEAEKAGVSMSNMVAMGLQVYREQRDAMRLMGSVVEKLEADKPGKVNG